MCACMIMIACNNDPTRDDLDGARQFVGTIAMDKRATAEDGVRYVGADFTHFGDPLMIAAHQAAILHAAILCFKNTRHLTS